MQGDSPGNARGDQDLSESVLDNFTQDDQPGQYMRSIETPAAEFYDQVKQQIDCSSLPQYRKCILP